MEKRLLIDYDGNNFRLITATKIVHGSNTIQDLTTMILAECKLGFDIKQEEPAYGLRFSSRARKSLDESQIETLRAVVGYHNQIANAHRFNQGGSYS